MKKAINKVLEFISRIPMPILLVVICVLSFGLLLPWLGFYMDDWYTLLYMKYFGTGSFLNFFQSDRPLLGWIYQVIVPIFKDSRLVWQLFSLTTYTLAVCLFWLLLKKVIPSRMKIVNTAALLFAVFPGFEYHWVSILFGQVFLLLAIYFLSFILMIESTRSSKGRVLYALGALVCLIIGVVPFEYFVGLELIRPIILWSMISQQTSTSKKRGRRFIYFWLPYLLATTVFAILRLSRADAYSVQPILFTQLTQSPWQAIWQFIGHTFSAIQDATLTVWVDLFKEFNRDLLSVSSLTMIGLIVVSGLSVFLWLRKYDKQDLESEKSGTLIWPVILTIICSTLPFAIGSLTISTVFPNDRFLIALAPAACVLLAVLIDVLLSTNRQKIVTSAILVGLAVGSHFMLAKGLMLNWQAQRDFFWQLAWRVPALEPGTTLVTEDLPFSKFTTTTSLSAPLNLIYAPVNQSNQLPYLFVISSDQQKGTGAYATDQSLPSSFRSFEFPQSDSKLLVFKKTTNGCLRILNPDDRLAEFSRPDDSGFWDKHIPLSNPGLIQINPEIPATPDAKYFGIENRSQWCYYFEKADLGAQGEQWDQVIQLYQQAQDGGYKPRVDTEWLPLLEAYLKTSQIDQAIKVTQRISLHDPKNTAGFCKLWDDAKTDQSVIPYSEEMISWLVCGDSNP